MMEKVAITKEDLLKELKDEYLKLRGMEKTASHDPNLQKKLSAVKARIDELECE